MEDLLGIIIPLLAVVGWLFGMFKNDEEEQKGGKQTRPRPSPARNQPSSTQNPSRRTVEGNRDRKQRNPVASAPSSPQTYYEEKKAKLAEAKSVTETDVFYQLDSIREEIRPQGMKKKTQNQSVAKKSTAAKQKLSIRRNLSKKGIAESVVMAEILGQPRSLRPYQRRRHTK
ncbi:hypothetical protein [Virgibacillus senegalensis]|uniref:hypothetical protein n=1 Tax=Virgibacillus senegalensis TaxID=1499679 RepID=UPI00069FB668|nr:hypothetical protein [Virgibacillus senegalensis]